VNGVEVKTWKEVLTVLKNVPAGNEVSVKLERGGSLYTVEVARTADFDFSAALGYPHDPVTVESAERGKPAASMGMRAGDKIASINGEPVVSWLQCLAVISGSKGQPIDIGLRRGEEALTIRVTPIPGRAARGEPPWMVGFRPVRIQNFERLSLLESVSEAGVHGAQASMLIVQVVGQLFTGKVSLREMQGVVGISVEAGRAARQGLPRFVELMALIGFNLAILNLLPIPILDGGHILMLAIEGIRGRDLSLKFKERFVQVGMVFLLVIFAIVMYNDVLRLLPGR
jgi:regulator of sigma E protease